MKLNILDPKFEQTYKDVLNSKEPAYADFTIFNRNILVEGSGTREVSHCIPGSFNPFHRGHYYLKPDHLPYDRVIYEICLKNFYKPSVEYDSLISRLESIGKNAGYNEDSVIKVMITNTPKLVDKTQHFRQKFYNVTYCIGSDLAKKVLETTTYEEFYNEDINGWGHSEFLIHPRFPLSDYSETLNLIVKMAEENNDMPFITRFHFNNAIGSLNTLMLSSTEIRKQNES